MKGSTGTRSTLTRRTFLGASAVAGASLVLGVRLPARGADAAATEDPLVANLAAGDAPFTPNAWINIDQDGLVTVRVHRSEMGQRVDTALPMIVADELEADWDGVRIEHGPLDPRFGSQQTGGSASISSSWFSMRAAAAAARTMLVRAAAATWGVDAAECRAEQGEIIHDASGRRLPYGELVGVAAALPVPTSDDFVLKEPGDFRIIGTRMPDPNGPGYVTGEARYTSDPQSRACSWPRWRGRRGLDRERHELRLGSSPGDRWRARRGAGRQRRRGGGGRPWAALQGRQALAVTWDEGDPSTLDSDAMREVAMGHVRLVDDPAIIEAVYEVPFLAHAPMEPMDCLADVRADHVEVWAPTQDRMSAVLAASRGAELPPDAVTVHVPLIGGAFGRRLESDYVEEACQVLEGRRRPGEDLLDARGRHPARLLPPLHAHPCRCPTRPLRQAAHHAWFRLGATHGRLAFGGRGRPRVRQRVHPRRDGGRGGCGHPRRLPHALR